MDLEISRITGYAYWRTVVGMVYSTVFDKYSSPVNGGEPKKYPVKQGIGGESGIRTRGGLLTLTRFPGVRLKPLIHLSEFHHSNRPKRLHSRALVFLF